MIRPFRRSGFCEDPVRPPSDTIIKDRNYGKSNALRAENRGESPRLHGFDDAGADPVPRRFQGQVGPSFQPSGDFTPVCTSEFMTFGAMSAISKGSDAN